MSAMNDASLLGPAIDLNADAGELDSLLTSDLALLDLVSSVNIACGGHAGSDAMMRALMARAADRGVAIGAHPGYADVEGFGRREAGLEAEAIYALCRGQVGRLARLAAERGLTLAHAKPHGALYHRAMGDPDAAEAVAKGCLDAVAEVTGDPFAALVFVGLPETPGAARWGELGLTVAREGFADRGYAADGSLLARGQPGAVLEDTGMAARQALELARSGRFDTLCVHGDTPGAVTMARAVRGALLGGGIRIASG
jgi:UPF0271 protein